MFDDYIVNYKLRLAKSISLVRVLEDKTKNTKNTAQGSAAACSDCHWGTSNGQQPEAASKPAARQAAKTTRPAKETGRPRPSRVAWWDGEGRRRGRARLRPPFPVFLILPGAPVDASPPPRPARCSSLPSAPRAALQVTRCLLFLLWVLRSACSGVSVGWNDCVIERRGQPMTPSYSP
jgi:hypothetical protein